MKLSMTALTVLCLVPTVIHGQVGGPIRDAAYDSAFFAWEAGDYPDALTRLQRLLSGADGARYVRPAAELTGEVFMTVELAPDGRAVRWSPDSRYAAFEVGTGADRRTHVFAAGDMRSEIAVVRGSGLAFDDRGRMAWVGGGPGSVTLQELSTGQVTQMPAPGLTVQSVFFRPGDAAVYVMAPTGAGSSDVHRLGGGTPERVTRGAGTKTNPVWLTDDRILYSVDRQTFAIEDLGSGMVRGFSGIGVTASADGSTVAWVSPGEGQNTIQLLRGSDAAPRTVVRTSEALSNPSLSRDGTRMAYQRMPREDWEVYLVNADGSGDTRLTREIQHDVLPRFVNDTLIFALMGEPRHRRSYLYDARTGARLRLFHNNTVRTVAPEYEWEVSPDGTRVLIVADRDGDTVSPERGVYMTDLTAPHSRTAIVNRVAAQLAAEQDLRRRGAQLFSGLEEQVRAAVADVSKDRVYRYSYDLFQFDSKYITQPGNQQAIEYLVETLRQWGYEPELQWFDARPRGAPGAQPATVRTANVIAKLPGTVHPEVLYTVSSHFDSVERGPGADDNTSGTAALLEAARVLATRPQPATVHFAFFTGEEAGLLGAREYVRRAVERGDRLVGALNNDMIGFANDQRLDNTIRYSNSGIRDIQHAAAFLFTDLITYDAKYYRSTDAHAFYDAYGDVVGGIGSYPILGNPHYHQTHDVLETINHQLVAEVSKTTVATLIQLANAPSRPTGIRVARSGAGADVTWDALPEQDIATYVVEWGPPGSSPRGSLRVATPRATLTDVAAGDEIRVGAINRRGAPAWDMARSVER
jgi:Tol biopolymer transport system component